MRKTNLQRRFGRFLMKIRKSVRATGSRIVRVWVPWSQLLQNGWRRYPNETQWPREEQATIRKSVALRVHRSPPDSELRHVNSVIGEQLRTAIEAASAHVITAARGPEVAGVYPLALRVRAELIRHRAITPTASPTARLVFLGQAWMSIDAAMATLGEIRFNAVRRGGTSAPDSL